MRSASPPSFCCASRDTDWNRKRPGRSAIQRSWRLSWPTFAARACRMVRTGAPKKMALMARGKTMAAKFDIAWEYYLQGFRLHHRMTREANLEAIRMFEQAVKLKQDGDFARAYSHWSFTLLTGLLNDWLAA